MREKFHFKQVYIFHGIILEKKLMPLGRLSSIQIGKGLKVLGVLEEKVKSRDRVRLNEFSNK